MKTYYVCGIIQVEVRASCAQDAIRKARKTQQSLNNQDRFNIDFDCISTDGRTSVGFEEAKFLDMDEESWQNRWQA